jgi:simple sugar transport system ATP-binding protein
MESSHEVLKVDGVTKAFPGVLANDAVSFDLRAGEVHSVIGENGAGKSTLMSLLFGLHRPDSGRIFLSGRETVLDGPRDAIAHGIGFVQQHYSLVPTLTVLDNIVLSQRFGGGRPMPRSAVAARVRELGERYRLAVDLEAEIERLSPGEQQRVELIKALIADPRVLILDEPAALLSPDETKQLWRILRDLAGAGVGIILIGHKLEDVLAVSDRITVLRRGRVVATVAASEASPQSLGALMVGELQETVRTGRGAVPAGPPVLAVRDLTVLGERGRPAAEGISLEVRGGEVLGLAGLTDSGQVELLEALAGCRPAASGRILLGGEDVTGLSIRARQDRGVGYVPADRHRDGLIGPMNLADNLALAAAGEPRISRGGLLRLGVMHERARQLLSLFDVRAAGPRVNAATLSGGNQQKLILARELARQPRLILCCYPTRGLDFAATEAIHAKLRAAADRGAAVVVASIDLEELFALADRLLVIQGGRIVGEASTADYSAERIGMMMGGGMAA